MIRPTLTPAHSLTFPAGLEKPNREFPYRHIVDEANEIIYRITPDGHFTFVNPTAAAVVRRSVEDCAGLHFLSLVRWDYREKAKDFYHEQVSNRTPITYFEFPAIASDGTEVWIGQSVQLVFEENEIVQLQGVGRDITQQKLIEQRLLDSEHRYRLLFDANPHPTWVNDRGDLSFLAVNKAAIQNYGYSEEDFRTMTLLDIRPESESEQLLNRVPRVGTLPETWKHKKKDGTIIDVEITSFPLVFDGKDAALITATDVTARLRAEAERQVILDIIQSVNVTANLEELLQRIHIALGRIVSAENCFIALHDENTDLIHFEYWADKTDPPHPPRPIGDGFTSYVLRTGEALCLTREIKSQMYNSGAIKRVGASSASWLGVPLRTPVRTIGVLVVQDYELENLYTANDVAFLSSVGGQIALAIERKRGEQALQEANARAITDYQGLLQQLTGLAEAFNLARDLPTVYRAFYSFARASTPCTAMLMMKCDANQTTQTPLFACENEIEMPVAELSPLAGFGKPGARDNSTLVTQMVVKGSLIGTVEVRTAEPARFEDTHIIAMQMAATLAATAIENIRLLEAEHNKEKQLRQAQKMEAIGLLAGGVAHDFNNLLTAITGYADLGMRKVEPGAAVWHSLEEIAAAARRAASLTRQLLAFSRQQVLQPKVFELNNVVIETEKMLRRLIGEDVELITKLEEPCGAIEADVGQIEQILMNLVVNARDALTENGRITIETARVSLPGRVEQDGEPRVYLRLSVHDNGTGISPANVKRIFEPFFTTKPIGKGTGLGLSTVHGVVEQSGGHIEVDSELGKGTCFKVYLPRVDKPTQTSSQPLRTVITEGTETVLIAEDEEIVRNLARAVLEFSGYTVLVGANGEEAIETAKNYDAPIDLLLTDIVMPRLDGHRLAREIKRMRPKIKTILMSGYADNALVRQSVSAGATAFLQKPFSPEALGMKVREELDKS